MKDGASLRPLWDLGSVGPATLRDLGRLGIWTVKQLARCDPDELYRELCEITKVRHDPCCADVFAAAVAQARNPDLPPEQCRWWYWSRIRKSKGPLHGRKAGSHPYDA